MRKPILLYIITKSELGGAQAHVYDLIRNLVDDYEIHLAVGQLGLLADRVFEIGVKVHQLKYLNRQISAFGDLLAIRELSQLVNKIKPDLIHAHSSKPGTIARLAALPSKTPTIYTAHGWGFAPHVPKLRRTVAFLVEKLLAPLSAKIICVCESDRQMSLQSGVGKPNQTIAIHNGIETEGYPLARPEKEPARAIVVARFNKQQKDHETLLRALPKIRENFHVDLVGTGPHMAEAEALVAQLGIRDRVSFLGDRFDVPELLARSQMFILTTHYEGLPVSILEAMRAGLPTIATNVNGIPEQVIHEKTGLLVPHQNSLALAAAIERLLDRPQLREEMGHAAQVELVSHFNVEQMVRQTNAIYHNILVTKKSVKIVKKSTTETTQLAIDN
jgi:glycosyltransferase involved in cell wall biosynthesis